MTSPNTFSVSFFLKKDKKKDGSAPLYARITVNGDYKDISTKRWVPVSAWNQKAQKIFGKTDEDIITKEKIRLTLFFFLEFDPAKHLQQLDFKMCRPCPSARSGETSKLPLSILL